MNSLDPRVRRLPELPGEGTQNTEELRHQFGTFEVFVQARSGKPFQHEGAVHAPNLEMAFIFAKENFTRRFTCTSLCVAETATIFVSPTTEGSQSVYELFSPQVTLGDEKAENNLFEIYQMKKRGKQHLHAGTVKAASPQQALLASKNEFDKGEIVYNIWVVPTAGIRFTSPDESGLWTTLGEKKFRDATDYKGGEKLNEFLNRMQKNGRTD